MNVETVTGLWMAPLIMSLGAGEHLDPGTFLQCSLSGDHDLLTGVNAAANFDGPFTLVSELHLVPLGRVLAHDVDVVLAVFFDDGALGYQDGVRFTVRTNFDSNERTRTKARLRIERYCHFNGAARLIHDRADALYAADHGARVIASE